MITLEEYYKKCEQIEEARKQLKIGKITREEFFEKYDGVPSQPLPDNFDKIAFDMCDYYRGAFELTEDGRLYEKEYTIFADDPDTVYFVYDTIFRGEYDDDPHLVGIPVSVLCDENARDKYISEKQHIYLKKKEAEEKKLLKAVEKTNFEREFSNCIKEERELRHEINSWFQLRKKYLPKEFDWIIQSLINRGLIESEHKQDYINYLKCDLI